METNIIERYDITQNRFDEFKVRLPNPVYGSAVAVVSDAKIFIAGGWSEKCGNSNKAITIDLGNGQINYLSDLPLAGWTVLPTYFNNGALHIFSQGEETEGFPDHAAFPINVPHN